MLEPMLVQRPVWSWGSVFSRMSLGLMFAGLTSVAGSPPAGACLNAVEMSRKQANRLAMAAEKELAAGNPRQARNLLMTVLGSKEPYDLPTPALEHKLVQLYAIACMRVGNQAAVKHSVEVFREQSKDAPKDPALKVRLAEALSHQAPASKEALSILEPLEKKDLIVDAEGYATLARLRKASGDSQGAEAALVRCRAMTKLGSVCSDAPLPPDSDLGCPIGVNHARLVDPENWR